MNSSSSYYLGVDGGQSSTKAAIGDATGLIVGRGSAGPCNHVSAEEARDKFLRTVRECVGAACASAGLPDGTEFRAGCFGMSGGPEDKASLLRESVRCGKWLVTHDGLIALSGALSGCDGIVAIGGTGSIVFGRRGDRTMRAGGWGYVFGDEGGAFWIVREALRAALSYEEGWGPSTALGARLREAVGAATVNEVLHKFYTPEWPRSKVATLAAEVTREAEHGDEVAQSILRDGGERLAQLVTSVHQKLWIANDLPANASFIGGAFRSPELLHRFEAVLRANEITVRKPDWDAAAGALIEAYRLDDKPITVREG